MSSDIRVLSGDLEKLLTPLDSLTPHPRNARRSDKAAIARSMIRNGVYKAIIYQTSTRHVLVGNHTRDAARDEGMTDFPAIGVDVDDATALRILLADNRIPDQATYDDAALADLLTELADTDGGLDGTGYADGDLDDLLAALEGDAEVLPIADTDAAYAETDDDREARAVHHSESETLAARGLTEMVVVLSIDDKDGLMRDLAAIREHLGADLPTGQVLQRAARVAVTVMDQAVYEAGGDPVLDYQGILDAADPDKAATQ